MDKKENAMETSGLCDKLDRALRAYISMRPLNGMDHVDYAVMINGEWGCGKTYFVRKLIAEMNAEGKQEKQHKKEQKEGHRCIYYSLNGVDSIESVVDGILAAATRYGVAKKVTGVFKGLGELFVGHIDKRWIYAVSNIASSMIKNKMLCDIKSKNIVLFLDDLERVLKELNMTDLLGQVYTTFIENNIKVVFIVNEKEIAKANRDGSENWERSNIN